MTQPRALIAEATDELAAAGIATPRVDAELLLAAAAGVARTRLRTVEVIEPEAVERFAGYVSRRRSREPLQHIVGTAPFRHLLLAVGPGVFVPRPETELLVDAVLPSLREARRPTVVDLCAGSGALGLAVAQEVPGSHVYLVERSVRAASWLHTNAETFTGVTVICDDVADPALLARLDGTVDAVLSNPPYVPDGTEVDVEVGHDPPDAVFAGPDGMGVIPAVMSAAHRLLRPGGILAMEHDETHADAVAALSATGWREVTSHLDLTGRQRFVTAIRPG